MSHLRSKPTASQKLAFLGESCYRAFIKLSCMDIKMNDNQEYIIRAMIAVQELYIAKTGQIWPRTEKSLFIHRGGDIIVVAQTDSYNFIIDYEPPVVEPLLANDYSESPVYRTFISKSDLQIMDSKQIMYTFKDLFGEDVDQEGKHLKAVFDAFPSDTEYRSNKDFWRFVLQEILSMYSRVQYIYPRRYAQEFIRVTNHILNDIQNLLYPNQ